MSAPAPQIEGVDLSPLPPGHLLPPRVFTSARIFDAEDDAIFARSWVHVADLIDVPEPGSYLAAQIGRSPVVILRDRKDGTLRGFLNACRHRGATLVEGRGRCDKQLQCPYHGWSYGHDGRLIGVPYRNELDADLAQMSLVPIRVGTVGPLIFACLDPAAPPLDEWIGALPSVIDPIAAWPLAWELTYELDVNWKVFVENGNDGYHIPVVHDLFMDTLVPDSGETTIERHGAYSFARINPKYLMPGDDPARSRIRFGFVFPNLVPVVTPVDLTYIRVDPIAHDRLRLFVRSYDEPTRGAITRDMRKAAFQYTTAQDIAVVQRVQRGLHARGLPAGVHARTLEQRVGHFERMWIEAMARGAAQTVRTNCAAAALPIAITAT